MELWRRSLIGIGVLALALCACAPKPKPKAAAAPDPQVAVVDGRPILASEVKDEAVAEGLISQDETFGLTASAFSQTLDEVIDQRLLAAEAERQHIDRDPTVQRRLAAARDRVLGAALTEATVAKVTTPDQIQKLYQETAAAAQQSDEVKLSQIVTNTGLEATVLKSQIQKGGESFESLALQRSTDAATRFKGGDLGGYIGVDLLPAAYSQAVRDAKIGDIVGPFQTDKGFVILKVQDRRAEAPVSLDSARPQIIRYLTYDQIKDLLENLRGKAKIQINASTPSPSPAPVSAAPTQPAAQSAPAPSAAPVNATPSSVKANASSLPKATK